ncbi:MAG TPA: hypothetical protein VHI97_02185, partial [Actinomycetota bacterium]|nr:hypothetical protein [Actinomycetota bacterium]
MNDPWAMVERAANDRSSGAAEIARMAAGALGRLPDEAVLPAIELLLRGHPSMAPLWRLGAEVLSAPEAHLGANEFVGGLLRWDSVAVDALTEALPGFSAYQVITISYSSSIRELVQRARPKALICMRSEPGGEGARAADAMSEWTNAVVMEDDDVLINVPGDAVVVGADAVTPRALTNKVKTRALADAARSKGIPVYAVAGETKLIGDELPAQAPFEAT